MSILEQRAAVGAEVGREEGKGAGGRAVEAVKNVITGKDGPNRVQPFHSGGPNAGVGNTTGFARTAEEVKSMVNRSIVTGEGDAYCPNPNDRAVPREFETRVQVIQKVPEMRTVEETFFVKEIRHEERIITRPRMRVVMEDHERIDIVPTVRQVPRTRIETTFRVVTEEREVTEMVSIVEMIEVPRIETVPRVITEEVQEMASVPVVTEVPQIRTVEVPTGNFCEEPLNEYVNPGHFNLLTTPGLRRVNSLSSSDDETKIRNHRGVAPASNGLTNSTYAPEETYNNRPGTYSSPGTPGTLSAPGTPGRTSKKKPSLFSRIENKLT